MLDSDVMSKLTSMALAFPGVGQDVACAGTALESRTFTVHRKAFLFVSGKCVRLKLDRSIAEARRHGAQVGLAGWAKVASDALPPAAVLKRWIAEGHGLIGGGATRKRK